MTGWRTLAAAVEPETIDKKQMNLVNFHNNPQARARGHPKGKQTISAIRDNRFFHLFHSQSDYNCS